MSMDLKKYSWIQKMIASSKPVHGLKKLWIQKITSSKNLSISNFKNYSRVWEMFMNVSKKFSS